MTQGSLQNFETGHECRYLIRDGGDQQGCKPSLIGTVDGAAGRKQLLDAPKASVPCSQMKPSFTPAVHPPRKCPGLNQHPGTRVVAVGACVHERGIPEVVQQVRIRIYRQQLAYADLKFTGLFSYSSKLGKVDINSHGGRKMSLNTG